MNIFGIKLIPLNTPPKKHLQTLAAALWMISLTFGSILGLILAVYLVTFTKYKYITGLYLLWTWFIDNKTPEKGGRRSHWVRSLSWLKYVKDYFPFHLEKLPGVELDPNRNYFFCGFPHGIIPSGGINSFLSEHSEFKKLFPFHTPYLAIVKPQLSLPFGREFLLSLGAISCSAKSIEYVLSRPDGGQVCAIMVGGAKEVYNCKPGTYRIILKNRKGFVSLALRTGASLVPFFSFGETDLYDQVNGIRLRRWQERIRRLIVMVPPLAIGRGFFQYSFGIIPRDCPVTTVVGAPIEVPKIADPTEEQIDELHAKFVEKLTELFEEQKSKYVKNPEVTNLIID